MIEVFKSIRPVSLIILLASILISYVFLKTSGMSDLTTMYQTMFGGKPLNSPILKGLFVMLMSLLQYVCIDYIGFYIDNSDTLSIRYGSKNNWLKALLKGASALIAAFLILFYSTWLLLDIAWGNSEIAQSININTVGVLVRIYLFCTIVVLVEIYLLLKLSKTSTFMIMGGISVLLAMTSHYQDSAFHILPQFNNPTIALINIIGNIAIALGLLVIIQRKNIKKELPPHED